MCTIMKRCRKCGKEKPATIEFFYMHKETRDRLYSDCIECRKEYYQKNSEQIKERNRQYQEKNQETIKVRRKKYYENNKETIKEKWKIRYQKNKEALIEYQKKYNQENEQKVKARRKKYYQKNKEAIEAKRRHYLDENREKINKRHREYLKTYKQDNPEKRKLYAARRRSLKRSLPDTYTLQQWKVCKEFFNNSCAYCGKQPKKLQQEHFIAVDRGGGYTISNIIPACRSCNARKSNIDFFKWYPLQPFYSKLREKRILKYLNFDKENRLQQASILELVKEEA